MTSPMLLQFWRQIWQGEGGNRAQAGPSRALRMKYEWIAVAVWVNIALHKKEVMEKGLSKYVECLNCIVQYVF